MELVSVIIPTHKRPRYLERAIDSVIAQTYPNWELIVVDDNDGSSDHREETKTFMCRYASNPKICYLKHRKNKGGSASRNTGIKHSTGKYVAFLDDDDAWLPTKLEEQIACFGRTQGNIAAVYTGFKRFNFMQGSDEPKLPRHRGNILGELLAGNCVGTTSTVMCTKQALIEVGLFDETLAASQDWDLYLRLAVKYEFDYIDRILVFKDQHEGERIGKNLRGKAEAFEILYSKFQRELEQNRKSHSLFLQRQGKLLLKLNEKRRAEEKFARAFQIYPLNSELLGQLLLSRWGEKYYHAARNISRPLRRFFRR